MQLPEMSIGFLTEQLRQRIVRLKEKYGVSYRLIAKEANISPSHLMRFVWGEHSNLTAQTLARLDETASRIAADREAR